MPSNEGELQPAAWSTAWNPLTEPYIFFVDGSGTVRAKLGGAFDTDELREAIDLP